MKNNLLICHKFYDKKNRRISAFGNFHGSTLIIYVVTCSNKDTFSRKEARERLMHYLDKAHLKEYKATENVIHPIIYRIPTTVETFRKDFLHFLYENYFIKEQMQVGIIGTNKMVVSDVYQNLTTKEIRVTNCCIKIISEKEMELHKTEIQDQQKREIDFEAYLKMIGTVKGNLNNAN